MADGPKSGGMRFGYEAHKSAGIPFRTPRSPAKINLQAFATEHPWLRDHIERLEEEGHRADFIVKHLREAGLAGKYCLERAFDVHKSRWDRQIYTDDKVLISKETDRLKAANTHRYFIVWEFDADSSKWNVIAEWGADISGE